MAETRTFMHPSGGFVHIPNIDQTIMHPSGGFINAATEADPAPSGTFVTDIYYKQLLAGGDHS